MTSEFRIPAPLQNTIDNLSFLAGTQPGDKLFFNGKSHMRDNQWFLRFRRYISGESLDTQIKIIREIVELGLDSLKSYSDNVHYHRLIKEFFRAKEGLTNLRNTYLKDGKEMGDIDNLIYIMENQLAAIKEVHKTGAGITPPEYKHPHTNSENSENSMDSHNSILSEHLCELEIGYE